MSEYQILTVLAAFAFCYSLVASRLERTPISGPLVYLFVGLACGSYGLGLVELNVDREGIRRLAEYTLALVLFADSANANLGTLRRVEEIPARLLLIGLPLTIAAGVAAGVLIFDSLTLLEIALLATMLAPTDAALGQAVVTNESVPDSVRESLNVESGLNDGICVPVLLIFLALASGDTGSDEATSLIIRLPIEAEGRYNRQQMSLYDRFTQFTLAAAKEAIDQSGLEFSGELAARSGVVLGTAGGGVSTWDDNYRSVYEDGKNRVHPFVVPKLMNNAAAAHVSMEHNLKGPSFTVSTACASSNHAMAQAFSMVRSGMASAMVTGGSESMLCFGGIKAWEGLRVMSRDACRPFSANRNGMVQGEGAGIFVFEEYERARARGADMLCEVIGFAMSSDAGDVVMPSKNGAARAMSGALKDAQVAREDV